MNRRKFLKSGSIVSIAVPAMVLAAGKAQAACIEGSAALAGIVEGAGNIGEVGCTARADRIAAAGAQVARMSKAQEEGMPA